MHALNKIPTTATNGQSTPRGHLVETGILLLLQGVALLLLMRSTDMKKHIGESARALLMDAISPLLLYLEQKIHSKASCIIPSFIPSIRPSTSISRSIPVFPNNDCLADDSDDLRKSDPSKRSSYRLRGLSEMWGFLSTKLNEARSERVRPAFLWIYAKIMELRDQL